MLYYTWFRSESVCLIQEKKRNLVHAKFFFIYYPEVVNALCLFRSNSLHIYIWYYLNLITIFYKVFSWHMSPWCFGWSHGKVYVLSIENEHSLVEIILKLKSTFHIFKLRRAADLSVSILTIKKYVLGLIHYLKPLRHLKHWTHRPVVEILPYFG